jgi:hypothetical protein
MGTHSRADPRTRHSGADSNLACRSHRAITTAEAAIEAMPGRPRLRIPPTIAVHADGGAIVSRPSTTARSLVSISFAVETSASV